MEISDTTVTVMVDSLDRSLEFYTSVLGFTVEYRVADEFAMVRRAGLRLGIHPRGDHPSGGDANGISFGFEVDDIRSAVSDLEKTGVGVPEGIIREGPLHRADFSDPDGIDLYLYQRGEGVDSS